MTYWNLIERYGPDRFARDLAAAGGAGAITPDLTPDEAAEWFAGLGRARPGPDLPRLAVLDRRADRLDRRRLSRLGLRHLGDGRHRRPGADLARPHPNSSARIRAADPEALVGVGLGVSNGVQAREVTEFADAVIVGSALVKALLDAEDAGEPGDLSRLRAVVADLAAGVREGRSDRTGTSGASAGLVRS